MKFLLLRQPHQMRKLRQDGDLRISSLFLDAAGAASEAASYQKIHAARSMLRNEQPVHLLAHTLKRQPRDPRESALHPLYQRAIRHKVELSDKPAGAKQAQRIFRKTLSCIPHRPQMLPLYIRKSAELVIKAAAAIHCHGVHREIATHQILFQRLCKRHLTRPMSITPILLAAECRHFVIFTAQDNDDRPEPASAAIDRFPTTQSSDREHFLRTRRRGDVPVMRHLSHRKIADAPAHDIALFPRFFQCF